MMGGPVRLALPATMAERARRYIDSGQPPAVARVAATVVLIRPAPGGGFEVYAQRRAATMAFAPGMYGFPGGTVDVRDADAEVGWAGPDPAWWAGRLGLDASGARATVCAAVREVFEECGVLLAGPDASTVVADCSGQRWEDARLALIARKVGLADLLAAHGLVVRSDLLAPWTRWLTPEFEPRRYDTYFFLARLPRDQRTRDVGGEADHTVWLRAADAAGLPMLPPTAYTMRELGTIADIDGAIDRAIASGKNRDLTTAVSPRTEFDDDGAWLVVG
jgi:8-oxo-dGTP pyrophosphatase MutT (NUDIX family)